MYYKPHHSLTLYNVRSVRFLLTTTIHHPPDIKSYAHLALLLQSNLMLHTCLMFLKIQEKRHIFLSVLILLDFVSGEDYFRFYLNG